MCGKHWATLSTLFWLWWVWICTKFWLSVYFVYSGAEAATRAVSGAQPARSEATTLLSPHHHRVAGPVPATCTARPHTSRSWVLPVFCSGRCFSWRQAARDGGSHFRSPSATAEDSETPGSSPVEGNRAPVFIENLSSHFKHYSNYSHTKRLLR